MHRPPYPKGSRDSWWDFRRSLRRDGCATDPKMYALLEFTDGKWESLNSNNMTWEEALKLKEHVQQQNYLYDDHFPFLRIVLTDSHRYTEPVPP